VSADKIVQAVTFIGSCGALFSCHTSGVDLEEEVGGKCQIIEGPNESRLRRNDFRWPMFSADSCRPTADRSSDFTNLPISVVRLLSAGKKNPNRPQCRTQMRKKLAGKRNVSPLKRRGKAVPRVPHTPHPCTTHNACHCVRSPLSISVR